MSDSTDLQSLEDDLYVLTGCTSTLKQRRSAWASVSSFWSDLPRSDEGKDAVKRCVFFGLHQYLGTTRFDHFTQSCWEGLLRQSISDIASKSGECATLVVKLLLPRLKGTTSSLQVPGVDYVLAQKCFGLLLTACVSDSLIPLSDVHADQAGLWIVALVQLCKPLGSYVRKLTVALRKSSPLYDLVKRVCDKIVASGRAGAKPLACVQSIYDVDGDVLAASKRIGAAVVANVDRCTVGSLPAIRRFWKSLTMEQFQEHFVSQIERQLKRSPELIVPVLTLMLKSPTWHLEMSAFAVQSLLPNVPSSLRSRNQDLRTATVSLLGAVAAHIPELEALQKILEELLNKFGSATVDEKGMYANAVAALHSARIPTAEHFSLTSNVLSALTVSLGDSVQLNRLPPSTVTSCLSCICEWTKSHATMDSAVIDVLVGMFSNGMKSPKLRLEFLCAASALSKTCAGFAAALSGAMSSDLSSMANDVKSVAAAHVDKLLTGVHAVYIFHCGGKKPSELEDILASIPSLPSFADATSCARIPDEHLEATLDVFALLLQGEQESAVVRILTSLLVFRGKSASSTCTSLLERLSPEVLGALCVEMKNQIFSSESELDGSMLDVICKGLVPGSTVGPNSAYSFLHVCSYLSYVCRTYRMMDLVQYVRRICKKAGVDIDIICGLLENPLDIAENDLVSEQVIAHITAVRALSVCAAVNPEVMCNHILERSSQWLPCSPGDSFTVEQRGIYETPAGQLWVSEDDLKEEKVVKVAAKQKADKAQTKLYGSSGAGNSSKKVVSKSSTDKDTSALLEQQAAVREAAGVTIQKARAVLRLILSLTRVAPETIRSNCAPWLALTSKCFRDEYTGTESWWALTTLYETVLRNSTVSQALQLCRLHRYCSVFDAKYGLHVVDDESALDAANDVEDAEAVAMVGMNTLLQLTRTSTLNTSEFALVYPILHHVLTRRIPYSYGNDALEIAVDLLVQHIPLASKGIPSDVASQTALEECDIFPAKDVVDAMLHCAEFSGALLGSRISQSLTLLSGGLWRASHVLAALQRVYCPDKEVRSFALQLVFGSPYIRTENAGSDEMVMKLVWLTQADPALANARLANRIWNALGVDLSVESCVDFLISTMNSDDEYVRHIAATSLAYIGKEYSDALNGVTKKALARYEESIQAEKSGEGDRRTEWMIREAVAYFLVEVAPFLTRTELPQVIMFFVGTRTLALGDMNETVRSMLLRAGQAIIDCHGASSHSLLVPLLDNFIRQPDVGTEEHDNAVSAAIILMGSLAKYVDSKADIVIRITDQLLQALDKPSQTVQEACSNCLRQLICVGDNKGRQQELVSGLFKRLWEGKTYGERYGAAYGLAGALSGIGLAAVHKYNVVTLIEEAIQEKSNPNRRESGLILFECISRAFGSLLEPYVVTFIPLLLQAFSDPVAEVRQACQTTCQSIMPHLTPLGVKLILPALLSALEERMWRTKMGSVEILGVMAYCAPKQTSASLPSIVPKLIQTLGDPHQQVQNASRNALQHVASVIRTPEVQEMSAILLTALRNPDEASKALSVLMKSSFMHPLDTPSLCLIFPILQRGLKDRSLDVRKRAADIISRLSALIVSGKEIIPYLDTIVPALKGLLTDPIPAARTAAARAFGSLTSFLGESNFGDLQGWFLSVMRSTTATGVERIGCAQGLASFLAAVGSDKVESMFEELVLYAQHQNSNTREAFVQVFAHLPTFLEDGFLPFLERSVSVVLYALSDEAEAVRSSALKAAEEIVGKYGTDHDSLELLLPALETGLFHDTWRIRQCTVELFGKLLVQLNESEDQELGRVAFTRPKSNVLGLNREEYEREENSGRNMYFTWDQRQRFLAILCMLRSDPEPTVRNSGINVWKLVVTNTPKTMKQILPVFIDLLLESLSADAVERRQLASIAMGELVAKMGASVMSDLVPVLQEKLHSESPMQRQGVCGGLNEIISSATREKLEEYVNALIPSLRMALCDSDVSVRSSAAECFESLYRKMGSACVNTVLPPLMDAVEEELSTSGENSRALLGLRELLARRASTFLPRILPRLTTLPLSPQRLRILAGIATESAAALDGYIEVLFDALTSLVCELYNPSADSELVAADVEADLSRVLSVLSPESQAVVLSAMESSLHAKEASERYSGAFLIAVYTRCVAIHNIPSLKELTGSLVLLYGDADIEVVNMGVQAMVALEKTVDKELLLPCTENMRAQWNNMCVDLQGNKLDTEIRGFSTNAGLAPIVQIFQVGLQSGGVEQKNTCAQGLGELATLAPFAALKPSIMRPAGSLIRVFSEQIPAFVRVSLLDTISIFIEKAGVALRPFIPQLQATLNKAILDPSAQVRNAGARGLGKLMGLSPKVDQIVTDTCNTVMTKTAEQQQTALNVLYHICQEPKVKLSGATAKQIVVSVVDSNVLDADDADFRRISARAFGAAMAHVEGEVFDEYVGVMVSRADSGSSNLHHGILLSLAYTFVYGREDGMKGRPSIPGVVRFCLEEYEAVEDAQIVCAVANVMYSLCRFADSSSTMKLLQALIRLLGSSVDDVRTCSTRLLLRLSKKHIVPLQKQLKEFLPSAYAILKGRILPAKLAMEQLVIILLDMRIEKRGGSNSVTSPLLDEYSKAVDADLAKKLSDYCRRVLINLSLDGGVDDDDDGEPLVFV